MTVRPLTAAEIEALYAPLFRIGAVGSTPDAGFTRLSWTSEETAAMEYVQHEAEKAGLTARFDAVGNLALEEPGYREYVETGSHVDTVVRGGNYDGAGGVICGLAAIRAIRESGTKRQRGLRLRIWRGEESAAFNIGCKGSRIAFGAFDPKALQFRTGGKNLAEAIEQCGYNVQAAREGQKLVSQAEIDSIAAHIELHIEQANALEQAGLDIGVVTSIRGPHRFRLSLEGRFDHSGGTPLGVECRRDTNLALAYIMVAIDELGKQALKEGHDLVQTVGVINSDPAFNEHEPRVYQNAIAKVSGYTYCTVDIRSSDLEFRIAHTAKVHQTIQQVAKAYRVTAHTELLAESKPLAAVDAKIQDTTAAAAKQLGYGAMRMPSGAMHDCVYVGEQKKSDGTAVPIGMIFIPCREGISHAPDEFTTFEALAKGTNVLALAMAELAQ